MKTLLILNAIAAVTAAPALAGERSAPRPDTVTMNMTVNFSDLDLSRTAGADALIVRLRKASQKVCGDAPIAANLEAVMRLRNCMLRVTDAAVKQVNQPMVAARYAREPAPSTLAAK